MIVAVFPGQGSQKPGMGQDLYRNDSFARQVFDEVERATGVNVALLCFESDEPTLRRTENAQLALFTTSLAAFYSFRARLPEAVYGAMAGHSVGEFAALVAAGIVSVQDGARLVQTRGQLMAQAGAKVKGTMAAVLGLETTDLQQVLDDVGGVCVIANDNCPGQIVISGEVDAVQRVSVLATERGAKRVLPLPVSGAFHSPLMEASSAELAIALKKVTFQKSDIPVYSNVLAAPGEDWPVLLQEQLKGRVRWAESVRAMRDAGATVFVEFGIGEVLTGLLRRIDRSAKGYVVMDTTTAEETAKELGVECK